MKNIVFTGFIAIFVLTIQAQTKIHITPTLENKIENCAKKIEFSDLPLITITNNRIINSKTARDLGTPIGVTYYDLQSNAANSNRIFQRNANFFIVWSLAPDNNAGFPGLGTGFNRSTNGGTSWLPAPSGRIEPYKTVWPNIISLLNNNLIIIAQTSDSLSISRSTDIGTNWSSNKFISNKKLSWTRMITNGNIIHLLAHTATDEPYQGYIHGAVVYMKSTNEGISWSEPIIPYGMDTSNYSRFSSFNDSYSFTGKGDTIAFVYGEGFRTSCLVKSTNNGESWSYKEILHLPENIKRFNTEGNTKFDINGDNQQDNIYGNDGFNNIVLDKTGKAHIFFGRMKYTDDGTGPGSQYFPYTDGLYYWNEDMGTIDYQFKWTNIGGINTYEAIPDTVKFKIVAKVFDIDNSGNIELPNNGSNLPFGEYYCSLTSMPNAAIAPDNTIVLLYTSIVENTDIAVGSEHKAVRNIWKIIGSYNQNNYVWSAHPERNVEDDYTEQVYPSIGNVIRKVNWCYLSDFYYQGDAFPGISVLPVSGNPHPISENTIYFKQEEVPPDGCGTGIKEKDGKSFFSIAPNPFYNYFSINYVLPSTASTSEIKIFDIYGKLFFECGLTKEEKQFQVLASSLKAGMYIVCLLVDGVVVASEKVVKL